MSNGAAWHEPPPIFQLGPARPWIALLAPAVPVEPLRRPRLPAPDACWRETGRRSAIIGRYPPRHHQGPRVEMTVACSAGIAFLSA